MTEKKRPSKAAPRRATTPGAKKRASSPPRNPDLARLGEELARTVDEVRRTRLDREKLLAIASAIAAIAKILGETIER
jgi:hypothetical protein